MGRRNSSKEKAAANWFKHEWGMEENIYVDISESFKRVTVKRNVTPVLDEGKVMQGRKEQSEPYGEELCKAMSVPQRKLQWQKDSKWRRIRN